MSTPIRARLEAASRKYASLCPMPIQDVRDAIALIDALRDRLKGLTDQIAASPKLKGDKRIHEAYAAAVALLERLDAESSR
jgi:hypothetical protein